MMTSDPVERLRERGIVAVLRAPTAEAGVEAVDALVRGGVTGIEVTYSTPNAAGVIREVRRRHGESVLLGAGTVLTEAHAIESVAAGATFLVSPGSAPGLAEAMVATGASVLLGALTPSEVMAAAAAGADVVKIFPASLGGPSYVTALRGPLPHIPMMPTGGVTPDNLADWFAAGVVAVGAGSDLCSFEAMARGRFDDIEFRAREYRAALDRARV